MASLFQQVLTMQARADAVISATHTASALVLDLFAHHAFLARESAVRSS